MFFFFNQNFNKFNYIKNFNKFFNKYYIFFFICFKNYYNDELIFFKNLNLNYLKINFKNFKKMNKTQENRFFKKNLFSKISFFKLKKLNNKIKYFNKNMLFYLYFFKKYKNLTFKNIKKSVISKNYFWFYFSNIYIFKITDLLDLKKNFKNYSVYKNNFKSFFFLNFYKNFFKKFFLLNINFYYKKNKKFNNNYTNVH